MKILILSRNSELYSTDALVTAAKNRGHEVRVVDYLRCYMNITSRRPKIYVDGEALVADAIIPPRGTRFMEMRSSVSLK